MIKIVTKLLLLTLLIMLTGNRYNSDDKNGEKYYDLGYYAEKFLENQERIRNNINYCELWDNMHVTGSRYYKTLRGIPFNSKNNEFYLFPEFGEDANFYYVDSSLDTIIVEYVSHDKVFKDYFSEVLLYFDERSGTLLKLTACVSSDFYINNKYYRKKSFSTCNFTVEFQRLNSMDLPYQCYFSYSKALSASRGKTHSITTEMWFHYKY